MNIFITGATGYIGAELTKALTRSGHIVHALIRDAKKQSSIEHPNIKFFEGNILDNESLKKGMENCEAVFHLAAYARVWAKDPEVYFKVNVEGTKNVLETALKLGVKKLVYTSTAGVIGPSYQKASTEESLRKVDFFNEYESSKSISENLIYAYLLKGLDTVVVYPSRVYGPGLMSDSNAVTKLIEQYIKGKWRLIPGDGSRTGSYAYIKDVIEGHVQALLKANPGKRYILGGENVAYNQLFDIIKKVSGKNHKLIKVPVPAMQAFGHMQMIKKSITGKPPLLTPAWIKKYEFDWSLDSGKAIEELDYKITPIEEGVSKTIEWLKDQNRINGK